jgi:hypothetical protein
MGPLFSAPAFRPGTGRGGNCLPTRTSWSMRSNIARWLRSPIALPACAGHRNLAKNTCAWKNNCWHSQIWRSQTMRNAWAGRMSCKMQNIRSSSNKADGADGSKGICDPKILPRLCRADRSSVPMGRHGCICQTSAAAIAGSIRDCGCTHVPWCEAGDAVPEARAKPESC